MLAIFQEGDVEADLVVGQLLPLGGQFGAHSVEIDDIDWRGYPGDGRGNCGRRCRRGRLGRAAGQDQPRHEQTKPQRYE